MLSKKTINNYSEWLGDIQLNGSSALIDKPKDWTSFDVVAKLRKLIHIKKIGHTGTLDPFATGLLIICFGKATKQINNYQDLNKTYQCSLKLGGITNTFDTESEEIQQKSIDFLSETDIINTVYSFIGTFEQIPPQFSAKKIHGKPAYKFARKNIFTELKPVSVSITRIDIEKIELPFVSFTLECSKGTYIRALARDIGEKLGCGAYLTSLRRTAIGDYKLTEALTIQEMTDLNVKAGLLNAEP
jgi:tRNA pseudouridine55 synthase